MAPQKYRVNGALFENENPNGPAFRGFIEIDGKKEQIALWPRTSNAGKNYLSIAEEKKMQKPAAPASKSPFGRPKQSQQDSQQGFLPKNDMDDEIPEF
jgi:hypothetical protein